MREFKVWFPEHREDADDARSVLGFDPEDAAADAVEDYFYTPDFRGDVGDELLAVVQDCEGGGLTCWRVTSKMEVSFSAEEEDVPEAVLTAHNQKEVI